MLQQAYIRTRTRERDHEWYRLHLAADDNRGGAVAVIELCPREDCWPLAYTGGLRRFLPRDHRAAVLYRRGRGASDAASGRPRDAVESVVSGVLWGPVSAHETDHVPRLIDFLLLLEFETFGTATACYCGMLRDWWTRGDVGVPELATLVQAAARCALSRHCTQDSAAASPAARDLGGFLRDWTERWTLAEASPAPPPSAPHPAAVRTAEPLVARLSEPRIVELVADVMDMASRAAPPPLPTGTALAIDAALVALCRSVVAERKPVEAIALAEGCACCARRRRTSGARLSLRRRAAGRRRHPATARRIGPTGFAIWSPGW